MSGQSLSPRLQFSKASPVMLAHSGYLLVTDRVCSSDFGEPAGPRLPQQLTTKTIHPGVNVHLPVLQPGSRLFSANQVAGITKRGGNFTHLLGGRYRVGFGGYPKAGKGLADVLDEPIPLVPYLCRHDDFIPPKLTSSDRKQVHMRAPSSISPY